MLNGCPTTGQVLRSDLRLYILCTILTDSQDKWTNVQDNESITIKLSIFVAEMTFPVLTETSDSNRLAQRDARMAAYYGMNNHLFVLLMILRTVLTIVYTTVYFSLNEHRLYDMEQLGMLQSDSTNFRIFIRHSTCQAST